MNETLSAIIDGFGKIEALDLRVHKVNITEKAYNAIVSDPECHPFDPATTFGEMVRQRRAQLDPPGPDEPFRFGSIYGADVVLSDKFEVFAEPGFMPSAFCTYEEPNGPVCDRIKGNVIAGPEGVRVPIPFRMYVGNLNIYIKSRANPLKRFTKEEARAIETLREMISETDYRRYMKDAFIMVAGASGLRYQIFRQHHHQVRVWQDGKIVEEICIYIPDKNIPATDSVIAFKTMIEADEEEFRHMSNVYNMRRAA